MVMKLPGPLDLDQPSCEREAVSHFEYRKAEKRMASRELKACDMSQYHVLEDICPKRHDLVERMDQYRDIAIFETSCWPGTTKTSSKVLFAVSKGIMPVPKIRS